MFGLFRHKGKIISMDEAREQIASDPSIRVVDVRTEKEYRGGHIPGSINVPMDRLTHIQQLLPDKHHTRLFVYCFSGSHTREACHILKKLGYHHVTNIGGIAFWTGELEYSSQE